MNKVFENMYYELLLEAAELDSATSLLRSMKRGQAGISFKKFFKGFSGIEEDEKAKKELDSTLSKLSELIEKKDFNKYLILILRKCGTYSVFKDNIIDNSSLNSVIDGFKAYFGNMNKKEAREEGPTKEKFDDFKSSKFNVEEIKKFEQWANDKFAEKATMKKGEADIIYNKGGWEVVVPLTFAAAKKYACLPGKKARWCTASASSYYRSYTKDGNKLYIIRNPEREILVQLDFGEKGGSPSPNINDEKDSAITIKNFKKLNVPDSLLKTIKNKKGKSVFDFLKEFEERASYPKRKISVPTPQGGEWKISRFSSEESFKKRVLSIFSKVEDMIMRFAGSKGRMAEILTPQKDNRKSSRNMGVISKGEENYIYIISAPALTQLSYEVNSDWKHLFGNNIILMEKDGLPEEVPFKNFMALTIPENIKKIFLDEGLRKMYKKDDSIGATDIEKKGMVSKIGKEYVAFRGLKSVSDILSISKYFEDDGRFNYAKGTISRVGVKNIDLIIKKTEGEAKDNIHIFLKDGRVLNSVGLLTYTRKEDVPAILGALDKIGWFRKQKYLKKETLERAYSSQGKSIKFLEKGDVYFTFKIELLDTAFSDRAIVGRGRLVSHSIYCSFIGHNNRRVSVKTKNLKYEHLKKLEKQLGTSSWRDSQSKIEEIGKEFGTLF